MTFRVLFLLSSLVGPSLALAESGWYGKPQANVRAIQVNNQTVVQATAGVEGGLRYGVEFLDQKDEPERVWSEFTGSIQVPLVLISESAALSGLPEKPGTSCSAPICGSMAMAATPVLIIDWTGHQASFPARQRRPDPLASLSSNWRGNPGGWAFDERRKQGGIGPFDELGLLGAGVLNVGSAYLTLGYQQTWNNVVIRGVILSGAI